MYPYGDEKGRIKKGRKQQCDCDVRKCLGNCVNIFVSSQESDICSNIQLNCQQRNSCSSVLAFNSTCVPIILCETYSIKVLPIIYMCVAQIQEAKISHIFLLGGRM